MNPILAATAFGAVAAVLLGFTVAQIVADQPLVPIPRPVRPAPIADDRTTLIATHTAKHADDAVNEARPEDYRPRRALRPVGRAVVPAVPQPVDPVRAIRVPNGGRWPS